MAETLISSSVLIAVLAVLRRVLKGRLRPGLQYALWLLVLIRLLVPVDVYVVSPVSVASAAAPAVERVAQMAAEPAYSYIVPAQRVTATEEATPVQRPIPIGPSYETLLRHVWLGGIAIVGLWFGIVNLRLHRKLRRTRVLFDDTRPVPVYTASDIPSPCLFGVFRPAIYLTEEAADPRRAEYVIAHELTHRRHGDGLWALLRVVCLAIYWFDPFVWLAAALSRRDCELFCDAATVKTLGEEHRFDYGRTLLDMTAVRVRPSDLLWTSTTMTGSSRSLKERISRIAKMQKTSALLCAAALVIAAVAVGCTFPGSAEADEVEAVAEVAVPEASSTDVAQVRPTDSSASDLSSWSPVYGSAAAANRQDPQVNALMENELYLYYIEYLGALGSDTWDAAAEYCWLDSEYSKNLSLEHHKPVVLASMIAFQHLSDDLIAIVMDMQTENRDEPLEVLNFVGRVDGKPCVFRNADSIPEELQDALGRLALTVDTGEEESLGPVNGDYWDDVNEVFGPFLEPVDVEVYVSDLYTPEDAYDLTFEDFVYMTDGWEFNSVEHLKIEKQADLTCPYIRIVDNNGRELIIREDSHKILIFEDYYLVTEITLGDTTGSDFLAMLFNWARQQDADRVLPETTVSPAEPEATAPPIADTPENLWGENWREGLTEEQIARLGSE